MWALLMCHEAYKDWRRSDLPLQKEQEEYIQTLITIPPEEVADVCKRHEVIFLSYRSKTSSSVKLLYDPPLPSQPLPSARQLLAPLCSPQWSTAFRCVYR